LQSQELMKVMITVLMCLLIWSSSLVFGQSIFEDRKIIILDAGHGGIDSGAVSNNGLQEKNVVLDIVRYMKNWNKNLLESKYDIYLTRNRDTLISLDDRTKLVKYIMPDVFISLHCNHINDPKIKGVELYTYDNNELSLSYGKAILNALNLNLGFKTRNPKHANFQVLRETTGYCPAVLIELGYLSNSDESDYLNNKQNRKALALVILMAI